GYEYQVINASVSGETTTGGLARLPRELRLTQPGILILELGANDALQGLPGEIERQPLQGVVGSQLQDEDAGLGEAQLPRQAGEAARGGLAAHAGVDHLILVPLGSQARDEQRHPTLLRPEAVGGAQAVAEYENGMVGSHRVLEADENKSDAK